MKQNRDGHTNAVPDLPSRDERAALEAAGGNAALARELMVTLVRELPNELGDLRRCFGENDWPLLGETAHRMRGATSYCGVPAMDNALQELERAVKAGTPEQIGPWLEEVEREAQRLTSILATRPE